MSKLAELLQKEAAGELAVVPGEAARNVDPLNYKLRKAVAPKLQALMNSAPGKFVRQNAKATGAGVTGLAIGAGVLANKMTSKSLPQQAMAVARRNPKLTAALAALGLTAGAAGAVKAASEKTAAEQAYENIELAKQAAEELAEESLSKLAFAEQLFNEANFVTDSLTKSASEVEDIETDGSALEAFLSELEEDTEE